MTQPPSPPPPPAPKGGSRSLILGIVVGVLFLAGTFGLAVLISSYEPSVGLTLMFLPLVIQLIAAITLSAFPRTSMFGVGLLIAVGIVLVVGAGVCFALIAGIGQ